MESLFYYPRLILGPSDPRTRDWLMIWDSPTPVIVSCLLYMFFVFFGRKYMQNRKAIYIPQFVMVVYNLGLVLLSLYMFFELIVGAYQSGYSLTCAKLTISNSESELRVAKALWLYFFSKLIEFLDTFFMIARKRFNQVTFLHVFHHCSMLFLWWFMVNWCPGGQTFFGATINCVVHMVMYAYYGLAVIPSLKDKLWWKKYITKFQLIQFVATLVHTFTGIVNDCEYPKWSQYGLVCYMVIMVVLFSNYYIHEYMKKTNREKSLRYKKEAEALNANKTEEALESKKED